MPNAFKKFDQLSFKGIEIPAISSQVGFTNDLVQHKYLFRSDPPIQPTGKTNDTFRYQIPFSENFEQNHFFDVFYRFRNACKDKQNPIGDLITPELGKVRAICVRFEHSLDPSRMRDGTIADVEFLQDPDDDSSDSTTSQSRTVVFDVRASAITTEAELDKLTDLDPTVSKALVNPLDAITGLGDQVIANVDLVNAQLNAQIFRVQELGTTIKKLKDLSNHSVLLHLSRHESNLRTALKRTGVVNGREIKFYVVDHAQNFMEIAKLLNVSVADLIRLNRAATANPVIPAGTILRYY